MNISRYKWNILFDATNKSPIFAAMKNNLLSSYKHIVIIYWILVSAVYAVQTFRLYYAVEEALLITFSVCSVVILVNHLLSDNFLTKAMREKNMPFFFVHFAWAVLLKSESSVRSDMYIRQGDSFVRIAWKDILYVEGMQNYLKLCFEERTLVIHQTMTSLEEMLPKEAFLGFTVPIWSMWRALIPSPAGACGYMARSSPSP